MNRNSRIAKLLGTAGVIVSLFVVSASAGELDGVHRYGDKDHGSYWTVIRASRHRVLSAQFFARDEQATDCGSWRGGWSVTNLPITNRRFRGTATGSLGDSARYWLRIRGKVVGETI